MHTFSALNVEVAEVVLFRSGVDAMFPVGTESYGVDDKIASNVVVWPVSVKDADTPILSGGNDGTVSKRHFVNVVQIERRQFFDNFPGLGIGEDYLAAFTGAGTQFSCFIKCEVAESTLFNMVTVDFVVVACGIADEVVSECTE